MDHIFIAMDEAYKYDQQHPDIPPRYGKLAFIMARDSVATIVYTGAAHMQGHWAEYVALPLKGNLREKFEDEKLREYNNKVKGR